MINFDLGKITQQVKEHPPLVHHITNYVTANDSANTVLALGGSPVMADELEEVSEMVSIASSLVINVGTLHETTIPSMLIAGRRANELGIPIILDPVGVGATTLRTKVAKELLEKLDFTFIRGNRSEMKSLFGFEGKTRGVDSMVNEEEDFSRIALLMARKHQTTVGITGEVDVISDGERVVELSNGHPRLTKITGSGCMATSIIGVYLGARVPSLEAGILGISRMAIAGELAFEDLGEQAGMESYRIGVMDHLSTLTPEILQKRMKMKEGMIHE